MEFGNSYKRRHGGIGQPIHKMPNAPLQSLGKPVSNNWLGDFHKPRSPNNIFSTRNDNPLDLQRYVIESLRNIKEIKDLRSYLLDQHAPGGLGTAYECKV
ncbi:MAG: hypothetical protein WA667_22120, partial [Candidatus Nitrosopolaris sp.]